MTWKEMQRFKTPPGWRMLRMEEILREEDRWFDLGDDYSHEPNGKVWVGIGFPVSEENTSRSPYFRRLTKGEQALINLP